MERSLTALRIGFQRISTGVKESIEGSMNVAGEDPDMSTASTGVSLFSSMWIYFSMKVEQVWFLVR